MATNVAERELAARKFKGMQYTVPSTGQARSKSQSKSPRRRKRERMQDPIPIDPTTPGSSPSGVVPNTARRTPVDPSSSGSSTPGIFPNTVDVRDPVDRTPSGSFTPDTVPKAVDQSPVDSSNSGSSTPDFFIHVLDKPMSLDPVPSGSSTPSIVPNTVDKPMSVDSSPSGSFIAGVIPKTVDQTITVDSIYGSCIMPDRVDRSRQGAVNASSQYSRGKRELFLSRRPHTTCGPRDKAHIFDRTTVYAFHLQEQHFGKCSRKRSADVANAESAVGEETFPCSVMNAENSVRRRSFTAPPGHSICNFGDSAPADETLVKGRRTPAMATEDIRAWEEELARIEVRSRRRSAEMGFSLKMKRITGDGFLVTVPLVACAGDES